MRNSTCKHCQSSFAVHGRGGTLPKYCSVKCAILANIIKTNTGCWEWQRARNRDGYGMWKNRTLHRQSYEEFKGPIPADLHVLHACDNTCCVNPDHLSVGTHKENIQDMIRKGRSIRGVNRYSSKLTEDQVREIYASTATGKEIGKQYGVSSTTVYRIRGGDLWSHITSSL